VRNGELCTAASRMAIKICACADTKTPIM
jgi:hypothetical protein